MIHHVSFGSNDLARSAAFYDPVLATVGLRRQREPIGDGRAEIVDVEEHAVEADRLRETVYRAGDVGEGEFVIVRDHTAAAEP